jgi:ElaB/YqjD/DUF883 family membrane-anchored ribosome-binding protein
VGSGSLGASNTGVGASSLGTGTDSLGVTGQGVDQNAVDGGPGLSASTGTWGEGSLGQQNAGQGLGNRLNTARDTATEKLQQARTVATERLGQAREKATELKSTLADKLEAGANSLRQQGQGGAQQFAGVGTDGTATASTSNDQLSRLATPAADAMQKTADFLRNGDLQATIENQVRTNPARTLLVAVGVGYLLGKALRNDNR